MGGKGGYKLRHMESQVDAGRRVKETASGVLLQRKGKKLGNWVLRPGGSGEGL